METDRNASSCPAPTPAPSVAAATPAPTVTSLAITSGVSFSAIGETGQLTATATYSDGTTKNVTTDVRWLSLAPTVFTVSSSGVVTVVGFGVASIRGSLGMRTSQIQVSATPPNTFVFYGRVREPGSGGIAGVRVSETQSGRSTLTDSEGNFSLAGLASAHLAFEKEGFEPGQFDARPTTFNDAPLQRIIRVTVSPAAGTLHYDPDVDRTAHRAEPVGRRTPGDGDPPGTVNSYPDRVIQHLQRAALDYQHSTCR